MLVHESRILRVTILGTLQANLNSLDFSLLLPDVMTIADEVDTQLTQSMESFIKLAKRAFVFPQKGPKLCPCENRLF
jgi:hypothetical protein